MKSPAAGAQRVALVRYVISDHPPGARLVACDAGPESCVAASRPSRAVRPVRRCSPPRSARCGCRWTYRRLRRPATTHPARAASIGGPVAAVGAPPVGTVVASAVLPPPRGTGRSDSTSGRTHGRSRGTTGWTPWSSAHQAVLRRDLALLPRWAACRSPRAVHSPWQDNWYLWSMARMIEWIRDQAARVAIATASDRVRRAGDRGRRGRGHHEVHPRAEGQRLRLGRPARRARGRRATWAQGSVAPRRRGVRASTSFAYAPSPRRARLATGPTSRHRDRRARDARGRRRDPAVTRTLARAYASDWRAGLNALVATTRRSSRRSRGAPPPTSGGRRCHVDDLRLLHAERAQHVRVLAAGRRPLRSADGTPRRAATRPAAVGVGRVAGGPAARRAARAVAGGRHVRRVPGRSAQRPLRAAARGDRGLREAPARPRARVAVGRARGGARARGSGPRARRDRRRAGAGRAGPSGHRRARASDALAALAARVMP